MQTPVGWLGIGPDVVDAVPIPMLSEPTPKLSKGQPLVPLSWACERWLQIAFVPCCGSQPDERFAHGLPAAWSPPEWTIWKWSMTPSGSSKMPFPLMSYRSHLSKVRRYAWTSASDLPESNWFCTQVAIPSRIREMVFPTQTMLSTPPE